jgi:hypothetical protein
MALKSTIDADAPDKVEYQVDRNTKRRGYWAVSTETPGLKEYIPLGYLIATDKHTIKTWFACTQAACTTFQSTYAGGGSIEVDEVSPVVKAYNLRLTETTYTQQWVDLEE